MLGFVDRAHAAGADQAEDAIARMVAERLRNLVRDGSLRRDGLFAGANAASRARISSVSSGVAAKASPQVAQVARCDSISAISAADSFPWP
jgi:hypothetical protein